MRPGSLRSGWLRGWQQHGGTAGSVLAHRAIGPAGACNDIQTTQPATVRDHLETRHMKRMIAATLMILTAGAAPALAQSCEGNFQVEGAPLVTAMNFRTSQNFPGVDSRTALGNLRAAMLAEGFINVSVDRQAGALTAFQETSGSGRPQTLRVSARKSGHGTRVDAIFMIQAGQVADANLIRGYLCRVVTAARS